MKHLKYIIIFLFLGCSTPINFIDFEETRLLREDNSFQYNPEECCDVEFIKYDEGILHIKNYRKDKGYTLFKVWKNSKPYMRFYRHDDHGFKECRKGLLIGSFNYGDCPGKFRMVIERWTELKGGGEYMCSSDEGRWYWDGTKDCEWDY